MLTSHSQPSGAQVVWLCRHGNRIDVVDRTWRGHDPHLSPDGVVQAKETAQRLRRENVRQIYSSPFLRTVETAFHIAEALDLVIKIEPGVCEWLNPAWFAAQPQWLSLSQLHERFRRIDLQYHAISQPTWPETRDDVDMRCRRTVLELTKTSAAEILIVGHGASVTSLAKGLVGPDATIGSDLCSLTKIVCANGSSVLELNGDTSHLTSGAM